MPERTRNYVVSEGQVRIAFVLSSVGGVLILVILFLMMSSLPQGHYQQLDDSKFQQTVERAAEALTGYDRDPESGALSIPIGRAMQLVVQRGVDNIQFGQAQAQGAAQPAAPGQQAGAAGGQSQLGATTYNNCAGCHQANGQGIPGAFPPLAGHLPDLYQAQGGRDYLIHVLLYGLQGPITVAGKSYNGSMPAWAQLSDEQIAAVLDHELQSWGNADTLKNFKPITPDEVKARRGDKLSPQDVHALRDKLELE